MTDLQKKLIAAAQRVEKSMNAHPFPCLYPGCKELPIQSHSQQESGPLKAIQRKGKVYTIRRRMETAFVDLSRSDDLLPPVCLTPISRATAFPGFCNQHEIAVGTDSCGDRPHRGQWNQIGRAHV